MRPFTSPLKKPTFANVVSVLALVVALSGTAYAADLAKDSVGSKQIKNNSVKSKDLKDSQITGADVRDGGLGGTDLAADSVGGAQVNEGSLGAVADSSALGGVPAAGYARSTPTAGGNFANGSPLSLAVSGYGTYRLRCNASTVAFEYTNLLGATANEAVMITAADGPLSPAETIVFNEDAGNGALFGNEGDRIFVDALIRSANGAKAIRMTLRGWSTATNLCFGFIEGQILR